MIGNERRTNGARVLLYWFEPISSIWLERAPLWPRHPDFAEIGRIRVKPISSRTGRSVAEASQIWLRRWRTSRRRRGGEGQELVCVGRRAMPYVGRDRLAQCGSGMVGTGTARMVEDAHKKGTTPELAEPARIPK